MVIEFTKYFLSVFNPTAARRSKLLDDYVEKARREKKEEKSVGGTKIVKTGKMLGRIVEK